MLFSALESTMKSVADFDKIFSLGRKSLNLTTGVTIPSAAGKPYFGGQAIPLTWSTRTDKAKSI